MRKLIVTTIVLLLASIGCGPPTGSISQGDFQKHPGYWTVWTSIDYGILPVALDDGILENHKFDKTKDPKRIAVIHKEQMKWAVEQKKKWDAKIAEQYRKYKSAQWERRKIWLSELFCMK